MRFAGSRTRAVRAAAPLLLLVASGCYEGFDPLDREVLAELARTQGDAQGTARSGLYQGLPETLDCGCEALAEDASLVTMCQAVDLATALGRLGDLHIEVIQADGVVRLRPFTGVTVTTGLDITPTLYGPLEQDGRISAGGVVTSDAVVVRGQVLTRVDGTLDDDGLVVELRQRYEVRTQLTSDREGPTQTLSYRCEERIGIDFQWVAPPAPSIPVGD